MRCQSCRNEIGNQEICPFCGSKAYNHGMQHKDLYGNQPGKHVYGNKMDGSNFQWNLDRIELKVNLLLVFSIANFLLVLLLLLVLAMGV